jgi:tetratricopeptide (TPR) repeat protein
MILEHASCGSMMDALTRPKEHAGADSDEDEEKKDEQYFESIDNNNDSPARTSTRETKTPIKQHTHVINNNNNTNYDTADTTRSSKSCLPPTPFFIMEWLKEVKPEDLELARKLLQTPNNISNIKQNNHNHNHNSPHRQHSSMGALLGSAAAAEEDDDDDDVDCHVVRKNLFAAATCSSPHRSASTGQLRSSQCTTTTTTTTTTHHHNFGSSMSLSSFRKRSIMIGNGWNAKGLSQAQRGRWREALACWENALEIRQQVLGDDHVDTANTYNNIGIALGKLNRVHEAISALQMALEIRTNNMMMTRTTITSEHNQQSQQQRQQQERQRHRVQQVAATLHNLANVHQQAGDLKMAMSYLEESIDLLLKEEKGAATLSPLLMMDGHGNGDDTEQQQRQQHDSVHLARAYVAIGHVYYETHQLDKAQQSYQQGLEILQKRGGGDNSSSDHHCEAEIESIQTDLDEIAELLRCRSTSMKEENASQDDEDEENE